MNDFDEEDSYGMLLCNECRCCEEHCCCRVSDTEFEVDPELLCPECWCNSTRYPQLELIDSWFDVDTLTDDDDDE